MVDPRIYRAGLALVAIAVIVFGFSLQDLPGPDTTSLVPPAYPGQSLARLNRSYPDRSPGSRGDQRLAAMVARQLGSLSGFAVQSFTQSVSTGAGTRSVDTVVASRSGASGGAIVVLSDRDLPGTAGVSGTAVLLALGRALAGETLTHPLLLVSTSGALGAAGADAEARALADSGQPIDAVIALGDLAAAHPSKPAVVPFSGTGLVAPPILQQTVGRELGAEAGIPAGGASFAAQFAHLALPMTATDQGPFDALGIPAVELSLSGERIARASEPVASSRPGALFAAVMQTVYALDAAPAVPAPGDYLELSGKLVPVWAVRLLVLALLAPVLLAVLDGVARVRRRGHSLVRWLAWSLAGAAPFLAAIAVVLLAGVAGVVPSPPETVATGTVPTSGLAVMAGAVAALVVGFAWLRRRTLRLAAQRLGVGARRAPETPPEDAAAVALTVVVCATALAVWVANPFAAALLVPAVHAWPWLSREEVRARRWVGLPLAVVGVVPLVLVAGYYAHSLGLTAPLRLAWSATLTVAGGDVPLFALLYWSVFLGCAASALILAARAARTAAVVAAQEPVITIRGPVGYAGPGSLGGTKSALRR